MLDQIISWERVKIPYWGWTTRLIVDPRVPGRLYTQGSNIYGGGLPVEIGCWMWGLLVQCLVNMFIIIHAYVIFCVN
jgi:hypothetical protein